jgi:hypothetical protein
MKNNNITTTMGDIDVNYSTEMMSLYEYLAKPAGPDLGKAVALAAKIAGVKIASHEISNAKYTGKILKYPKLFLDGYFSTTVKAETITNNDDDLPF